MRTPLNPIIGFTHTLLPNSPAPSRTNSARSSSWSRNSGAHLLTLVDDLLSALDGTPANEPVTVAPFSANALVQDLVSEFSTRAFQRGLDLRVDVPDEEVVVVSDRPHLAEALRRLVDNALRFTEQGWVEIALEAPCAEHPDSVRFSVSDSGPGIDEEDLRHVVSGLYQPDDVRSAAKPDGLGLGLLRTRRRSRGWAAD